MAGPAGVSGRRVVRHAPRPRWQLHPDHRAHRRLLGGSWSMSVALGFDAVAVRPDSVSDVRPEDLEHYRRELTGYCYRMLGSVFEADDAIQETMVRAWQGLDGFEGRSSLRSWLYRIATNVCLDMLRGRQRRAVAMDLGPSSTADSALGPMLPEHVWMTPCRSGHGPGRMLLARAATLRPDHDPSRRHRRGGARRRSRHRRSDPDHRVRAGGTCLLVAVAPQRVRVLRHRGDPPARGGRRPSTVVGRGVRR